MPEGYPEAIIGFIGVLLGSAIVVGREIYADWKMTSKSRKYLAIRVTTLLDYFIEKCAQVASDTGEPDQGGYYHATTRDPEIELLTLDVEWKSIPADLMYKILSFPGVIQDAKNYISDVADHSDPPDYSEFFTARRYKYSEIGMVAAEITSAIRLKYSIPQRHYEEWNPAVVFHQTIKEVENYRIERAARRDALRESLRTQNN